MKSSQPKVLHLLLGRPLIYYVVAEVLKLQPHIKQVIVVVGYKASLIEAALRRFFSGQGVRLEFVRQEKPRGTAHALSCALKRIRFQNILVLCGDAPLIGAKTLRRLLVFFSRRESSCTLLSAYLDEKNAPGVIMRDRRGRIKAIQEKAGLEAAVLEKTRRSPGLQEANSGIYVFRRKALAANLKKIAKNKRKGEYFLTDIIGLLYRQGVKVDSQVLKQGSEVLGINTQADLDMAEKIMRSRLIEALRRRGVTIVDAPSTFIAPDVIVGKNTVIYPFTFIEEGVIIGSHCQLGPFLHIRTNTRIGNNTHAGNFLEINRCRIGNNVKIKHFGYLGDADIADNANIGAGTVVANFDGWRKHKTVIGQGAFVGSDTVLVAPVKVGKQAATGAGSVVTRDVEPKTTVVGVPAREIKTLKASSRKKGKA